MPELVWRVKLVTELQAGVMTEEGGRLERDEQAGLADLTTFTESAVNEIVAKRMTKKQQMRWNRTTVQSFLEVRTVVLNDTLEDAFRRRYSGFRPANEDEAIAVVA